MNTHEKDRSNCFNPPNAGSRFGGVRSSGGWGDLQSLRESRWVSRVGDAVDDYVVALRSGNDIREMCLTAEVARFADQYNDTARRFFYRSEQIAGKADIIDEPRRIAGRRDLAEGITQDVRVGGKIWATRISSATVTIAARLGVPIPYCC